MTALHNPLSAHLPTPKQYKRSSPSTSRAKVLVRVTEASSVKVIVALELLVSAAAREMRFRLLFKIILEY